MKGKIITIYGINNIGKTTHAKLLAQKLKNLGYKSRYIKYPIYNIKPTGEYINKSLRDAENIQNISEEELQLWFVLNRYQFQPKLKKFLEKGEIIIAEDYIGTGIAWGVTKGAELKWLENINKYLLKEELSILIHGERQISAKEKYHIHESNDKLINKCQLKYLKLAKRYGWKLVKLEENPEQTAKSIWKIVSGFLKNL